jgi:hypothetical protein
MTVVEHVGTAAGIWFLFGVKLEICLLTHDPTVYEIQTLTHSWLLQKVAALVM